MPLVRYNPPPAASNWSLAEKWALQRQFPRTTPNVPAHFITDMVATFAGVRKAKMQELAGRRAGPGAAGGSGAAPPSPGAAGMSVEQILKVYALDALTDILASDLRRVPDVLQSLVAELTAAAASSAAAAGAPGDAPPAGAGAR